MTILRHPTRGVRRARLPKDKEALREDGHLLPCRAEEPELIRDLLVHPCKFPITIRISIGRWTPIKGAVSNGWESLSGIDLGDGRWMHFDHQTDRSPKLRVSADA